MGALDRRDYELCSQAMEITAKAEVKAEHLKRIAQSTEDLELKRLCAAAIAVYGNYPGPEGSHKEWLLRLKQPKANLQHYINIMLKDDRPRWKVIAEQNGWGPNADWKEAAEQEFLALRQEVASLRRQVKTIRRETAEPLQAKIEELQAVIDEQDKILNEMIEKQ